MQKNLLFLAYHYLPQNNAGVQRIEKLVKYLPAFGWQCFVLTCGKKSKEDGENIFRARELFKKAENNQQMFFTDYSQNKQSFKIKFRQWARDHCLIPDSKIFWLPAAFIKAIQIIRQKKIEFVFSSFPPGTSHLLGLLLKWFTNKIWIADFRDGWMFDPLDPALNKKIFKTSICRLLEKLTAYYSDIILTTSPDVQEYFMKKYKLKKKKCFLIMNGYDEDDFQEAEKGLTEFKNKTRRELVKNSAQIAEHKNNFFLISHTGAFSFSHLNNTPQYFLKGLKNFLQKYPETRKDIKVVLAGNLTAEEKNMPRIMGLGDVVLIKGLISHLDSIRLRLISDLLLLVDASLMQGKERSSYIHGKLFEHLRAQKSILALVPSGAVRDFLKKHKIGTIIEPNNIQEIAQVLFEVYNKWKNDERYHQNLDSQKLNMFNRKILTKKLDKILQFLTKKM